MDFQAYYEGFFEKLARAGWTSARSAKKHAKKHSARMHMTADEYFAAARKMRKKRSKMKPVPQKGGKLAYWDSKTGKKLVTTPDGRIVTFYDAGAKP